jgi:hypothetical protein
MALNCVFLFTASGAAAYAGSPILMGLFAGAGIVVLVAAAGRR